MKTLTIRFSEARNNAVAAKDERGIPVHYFKFESEDDLSVKVARYNQCRFVTPIQIIW